MKVKMPVVGPAAGRSSARLAHAANASAVPVPDAQMAPRAAEAASRTTAASAVVRLAPEPRDLPANIQLADLNPKEGRWSQIKAWYCRSLCPVKKKVI